MARREALPADCRSTISSMSWIRLKPSHHASLLIRTQSSRSSLRLREWFRATVTVQANATDNVARRKRRFQARWCAACLADVQRAVRAAVGHHHGRRTALIRSRPKRLTPLAILARHLVTWPCKTTLWRAKGPTMFRSMASTTMPFVADGPALSFGTGTADTPFTVEMWVRPDSVLATASADWQVGRILRRVHARHAAVQLVDNSAQARTTVYTGPGFRSHRPRRRMASPGLHLRRPRRRERRRRHHCVSGRRRASAASARPPPRMWRWRT